MCGSSVQLCGAREVFAHCGVCLLKHRGDTRQEPGFPLLDGARHIQAQVL